MAHGAVEAHEIAEQIHEHARARARGAHDGFRRLTGIYVGVVAMLLAIATLGGAEATKEMLNSNIHASDTYAFYQAEIYTPEFLPNSAAELELLVAGVARTCPPSSSAKANELVKRYRDTVARYESEPADRRRQEGADGQGQGMGEASATTRPSKSRISNMPRRCFRSRSCSARSRSCASPLAVGLQRRPRDLRPPADPQWLFPADPARPPLARRQRGRALIRRRTRRGAR